MRESILIIAAAALYVVVCHLDYEDAQQHEQVTAQHWADIQAANSGISRNIDTENSVLNVRHSTF